MRARRGTRHARLRALTREADLFRKTIFWSIGLLLVLCVLIYLQSNVLAWMLP